MQVPSSYIKYSLLYILVVPWELHGMAVLAPRRVFFRLSLLISFAWVVPYSLGLLFRAHASRGDFRGGGFLEKDFLRCHMSKDVPLPTSSSSSGGSTTPSVGRPASIRIMRLGGKHQEGRGSSQGWARGACQLLDDRDP